MENVKGYQLKEKIHESDDSRVFRAVRQADGVGVILKTSVTDFPTPRDLNRLKHEFSIGSNLQCAGAVKYLSMEGKENSVAVVMEDFGGVSLRDFIGNKGMDLKLFFELAKKITTALGEIHERNIIHKDVNPSNILFNSGTREIKISDFGISTSLQREKQEAGAVNSIEGTLAYLSPEQTGRMNRTIDYRSDFYSLGITFYEMLSGETPFVSKDKLELIHAHIARAPKSLSEVSSKVPQMLSDIVMKLLSKTAEARYKSAFGLLIDLKQCEEDFLKTGSVKHFEAGKKDVSSQFNIPEKLYGRDTETKILLDTFGRVCEGSREILMVSGYSGIGKSALVNEIHKPVVSRKGYFISGKFDQFQRNLPYSAMISAYRQLIQQLLTESDERRTAWKEKFLLAFGPNGQLMIDVIPELELIIGKQLVPTELNGEATRNRFTLMFRNFIKSLTSAEHPLVVFLDDLQWADSATINLIHDMMQVAAHNESKHLFLIGAYRDNEVNAAHPLMIMFEQIKEFGAVINNVVLSPLNYTDVQQLVADTLECSTSTADSLAKIVHEKTLGNPFFINQFIRSLHDEELLTFNSANGEWTWDNGKIKQKSFTDNVIDLMSQKIKRLAAPTQNAMKLASTAGTRFEISLLSNLLSKSNEEIRNDLREAVNEGLVIPNSYSDEQISTYKFLHDRVQQAAYSLLNENELLQAHYKIGKLIRETANRKTDEKLFDIVNHLNFSKSLISNAEEKKELAILNLQAATKAKASNAYGAASDYLNTGISLLPADSWSSDYKLSHSFFSSAVEASFLNKDFAQMGKMLVHVETNSKELIDKIPSLEIKIQALSAQSKMIEAIVEASAVLNLLGVKLPKNPGQMDIMSGLMGAKWAIGRKKSHELIDLPEMKDPLKLAAMRILISTTSAAFLAMPNMFPVIVFNLVKLSLNHGNSKYSAYGYATYGLVLCGALGDMKGGNEFGTLALNLMSRYDANEFTAKVYFVYNCFIFQWQHAMNKIRPYLLQGYQSGLETGDFEYGGWCAFQYCTYSFFAGENLSQTERSLVSMLEQGEKLGIKQVTLLMEIWLPVIRTLMATATPEENLLADNFKDTMIPAFQEIKYPTAVYERYLSLGQVDYYFHRFEKARKYFDAAEPMVESVMGMEYGPQLYFFHALTLIRTLHIEPSAAKKKLNGHIKKLKKWANDAPANYQHKYELIMAEYYRTIGNKIQAADFYDLAIEHAHKNKYLNDEAIANECAAEFYLALGKKDIALTYTVKARYAYMLWGAKAKVDFIDSHYQQLLSRAIKTTADYRNKYSEAEASTKLDSTTTDSVSVDMLTVIKASQTISGEIVFGKSFAQVDVAAYTKCRCRKRIFDFGEKRKALYRSGEFSKF